VWISDADYSFLATWAESSGETVSTVIRRMIRNARAVIRDGQFTPREGRVPDGIVLTRSVPFEETAK